MLKSVPPDIRIQPTVDRLVKAIRQGKLLPGQKVGTEVELAASIGISRGYVRRAVEQLIEQGLIERRAGKGLYVRQPPDAREPQTRRVQVIVPDLINDIWTHIARGAQVFGRERGVEVHVYDTHGLADESFFRKLPESFADGAIVAGRGSMMPLLHELHIKEYPIVVVDWRPQDQLPLAWVASDNYAGGYTAGKELTARGHRRIGFISSPVAATVRDRLEGFRDAIADAGLAFDRSLAIDVNDRRKPEDPPGDINAAAERATIELLCRPDPVTAIFYHCDQLAISGYRMCKSLGLRIPQDLSIVGFDGDSVGELLDPSLATLKQDLQGMGAAAMELLLERMNNPQSLAGHRELPTEWVPRESIAAPSRQRSAS